MMRNRLRNLTYPAALWVVLCGAALSARADEKTLARWEFPDPGPATAAVFTPTVVEPRVVVSAIANGPGVVRHPDFNDPDRRTSTSYVAHASAGANGFVPTASAGGGESGGAFMDYLLYQPDAYLLAGAISSGAYVEVSIGAEWADVTITELAFYAQRSDNRPERCVANGQWQVDTGAGYTNLATELTFAETQYERAGVSNLVLFVRNGESVGLRLYCYGPDDGGPEPWGRSLAIDDLAVIGRVDPIYRGTVITVH